MRREGFKHGRILASHVYSRPAVQAGTFEVPDLETKEMHTKLYPNSLHYNSQLLKRPKGVWGTYGNAFVLCPKPTNASFRSKSSERYGFHFCRQEWRVAFRTIYRTDWVVPLRKGTGKTRQKQVPRENLNREEAIHEEEDGLYRHTECEMYEEEDLDEDKESEQGSEGDGDSSGEGETEDWNFVRVTEWSEAEDEWEQVDSGSTAESDAWEACSEERTWNVIDEDWPPLIAHDAA